MRDGDILVRKMRYLSKKPKPLFHNGFRDALSKTLQKPIRIRLARTPSLPDHKKYNIICLCTQGWGGLTRTTAYFELCRKLLLLVYAMDSEVLERTGCLLRTQKIKFLVVCIMFLVSFILPVSKLSGPFQHFRACLFAYAK